MRLWPRSLAGQLIAGLLLVVVAAHLVSFFAFVDERRFAVQEASRFQALSRIASVVRLVELAPKDWRGEIARQAGDRLIRFTLSPESEVRDEEGGLRTELIRRRLARRLERGRDIRIGEDEGNEGFWRWAPWERLHHDRDRMWFDRNDDDESVRRFWMRRDGPGSRRDEGMVISVKLTGGGWLNARTLLPPVAPSWAAASMTAMVVTAILLVVMVVLLVRRVTRPLAGLAAAAERGGDGQAFEPVPEEGPKDVRDTIQAFNRMQERQQRFIAERTRMLAAISHDLRTPITSLRIRAEFIDNPELQEKILATLDEMQAMAEATLGFVREDATEEAFSDTDLDALAESVAADVSDLGGDVSFTPLADGRAVARCRPGALRRALRNIIDNALAYAGSAGVRVERGEGAFAIVVDDDGPGISDAERERVFEPFVRLEESRNRETGGVGLGLAIVRAIMRAHGGDVRLENRDEGGLRVTLLVPARAA
jgi:signal transduction histidine kinase